MNPWIPQEIVDRAGKGVWMGGKPPEGARGVSLTSMAGLALGLAVAGCAASALPYQPAEPSSGVPISADYRATDGRLRVELATRGYRVEEVAIVLADGGVVPAETLEYPLSRAGTLSLGVGFGGGTSFGSTGASAGVGMGTGVGGDSRAPRTFAVFSLARIGPPPWTLRVKVVGAQPVLIRLPAPAGGA